MEEGNEPTIIAKRIKFEEENEDRISLLPDCLLVEILSRLPSIDYAIRTGSLSKRWQHLWTFVYNLIFISHSRNSASLFEDRTAFFPFVDKTLIQCRQSNINKFEVELHHSYKIQFESQVRDWIRYAVSCNVKELNMQLLSKDLEAEFVLKDDFIFINSSLTHLTLEGCIFNPTGPICWKNLINLDISHGNLDEESIENILFGSPLLETLTLSDCYGYNRLDITSKSVKNLVFSGYWAPPPDDRLDDLNDIIEINAPDILSLTIQGDLLLWMLLLLHVSSLVNVDLNYTKLGHSETTRKEAEDEMLKGFIVSLPHVKELKIGILCFKAFFHLEASGFKFPASLKVLDALEVPDWSDCSDCSDSDSAESGDHGHWKLTSLID